MELKMMGLIINLLIATQPKWQRFIAERQALLDLLKTKFTHSGKTILALMRNLTLDLEECKDSANDKQVELLTCMKKLTEEDSDIGEEEELKEKMRSLVLPDSKLVGIKREDIIGIDDAIRSMREGIEYAIRYPYLFENGHKPWKGILLYGPPGSGKTMLAKYVAKIVKDDLQSTGKKLVFMNVTPADLASKYFGGTEKAIKAMFDVARENVKKNKPTVIFFDEVDSVMRRRTSQETETVRRVKTMFLTQLDGFEDNSQVVFIGATNTPQDIDTALLRRMEKQIFIDLPHSDARKCMIKHALQANISCSEHVDGFTDNQIDTLVKDTEMYSAADIATLMRSAYLTAISDMLDDSNYYEVTTATVEERNVGRSRIVALCSTNHADCMTKKQALDLGYSFRAPRVDFDIIKKTMQVVRPTVDSKTLASILEWKNAREQNI